jgi:hypothetical protein
MKPIKGGQHPAKNKELDKMIKDMAEMAAGNFSKPKPSTSGIVYSKLLLELIKPYQQSKGIMPVDELEYLLDLGIAAWNLAVYKTKDKFFYTTYLRGMRGKDGLTKEDKKLLMKLVADKEKRFGQYTDTLLEDFEIMEEKDDKVLVNVISKPFGSFIEETLNEGLLNIPFESAGHDDGFDDKEDDAEYEDMPDYILPVVNRNAVMIKAKQPFHDWLRKIYFPEVPPQLCEEPNLYLLPDFETDRETEEYLKNNFNRIFGSELWGWNTDEQNWPANRTYKMFKDWFEVKMQCMVIDMANYPLEKE